MTTRIVMKLEHTNIINKKWIILFLTRHSNIHFKIDRKIEVLRIQNTNINDLNVFFVLFRRIRSENNVIPKNIWNMNELDIVLECCIH